MEGHRLHRRSDGGRLRIALTTAKDFRLLTPLVLMSAIARAGTVVCEPIHRFRLEAPSEAVGAVLGALTRLQGVPREQTRHGEARARSRARFPPPSCTSCAGGSRG